MNGSIFTRIIACLLFFLTTLNTAYSQPGSITVTITSPNANQVVSGNLVNNLLYVQATINSTYAIDTVKATVRNVQVLLAYNSSYGAFTGTLPLSGLPRDTLTLTVTAIDVQHDTQSASRPFIYVLPPVITIIKPSPYPVARPNLAVQAKCVSDSGKGACSMTLSVVAGTTVYPQGTFTDSFSTTLDLSPWEGTSSMSLQIQATDAKGESGTALESIFVETSPYLQEYYSANNEIATFGNRKVFVMSDSASSNPRVVNLSDSSITPVPYSKYIPSPGKVYLTSTGAVFLGQDSSTINTLHDWNSGSLYSLEQSSLTIPFQAAGNYCWYGDVTGLELRDLGAKTQQLLRAQASGTDIRADGTVVYSYISSFFDSIYLYKSGVSAGVSNNASGNFAKLGVTDGKRVAYLQMDASGNSYIYLYDGASNILLSNLGQTRVNVGSTYLVNNGYQAYVKTGTVGQLQVWLRDSTGSAVQATNYNTSSNLEQLGANGDLTYLYFDNTAVTRHRYFYSRSAGTAIPIGTELGAAYYRDSAWYVQMGNTLFRINTSIPSDSVISFSILDKVDSSYSFTTTAFASQFQGPGVLMKVKIATLPANGKLTLKGANVTVGQEIVRTDLATLKYAPNNGFTGLDTIRWNGSNGYAYTPSNAYVQLNVNNIAAPPLPSVTGLVSSYCQKAGLEKGKITNFPDTTKGTQVMVTLNDAPLAIQPDSSFSFIVNSLSPGSYHWQLSYSNIAGTQSLAHPFTVLSAVTPGVAISSNITAITAASGQILITASNDSDGGSAPLYTFAKDAAFDSVLQTQSSDSVLSLEPTAFRDGDNWVYVKMQTSDTCYNVLTAVDSIRISKSGSSGTTTTTTTAAGQVGDPDFPGQLIGANPNPFNGQLNISGLQTVKNYSFTLVGGNGEDVTTMKVSGQQNAVLITPGLPKGVYLLRIYDETKHRLLGSIKLAVL